jgi:hypothetical protein
MVPPTTASLTVLPIISNIFFEEQELLFDATLILIPVPGASAYGSVKLLRFMAKHPKITKNLCPVCEFTTANHRDGATNNRIPNSIANHLKHIL